MLFLPFAALLAALGSAYSIPERQLNNHLKMDFSVLRGNSRSAAVKGAREGIVTRGDLFDLVLDNEITYYSSTLKVGSNGDETTVLVDTGSSDLWIMSSDVRCYARPSFKRSLDDGSLFPHHPLFDFDNKVPGLQKRDNQTTGTSNGRPSKIDDAICKALGSFSTAASGSFHLNTSAPDFSIAYADRTYANGVWGSDYVSIGSLNVSECNFAVVNETTSDVGVFGIGLPDLEVTSASASVADEYTYENFPIRLKSIGAIKKVAYSLYLNNNNPVAGSVLFGAVDHAKYSGKLQTVPLINLYSRWYDHPITFHIVLNSVTLGDAAQEISLTNSPFTALLDSGSTLSYLPTNVVKSIAALLNGKINEYGFYEVDCIYNTSSAYLDYNFSGAHIKVPLSDLILSPAIVRDSKCYLGIKSKINQRSTLGDNFLRHAYVVYDLEQYEISLAQVKYTDTEDIEIISNSVPLAVKAPGYYSTSLAQTIVTQSTIERLTFATTTSHWTGSETSTTTVTNSGAVPTVVVEIPYETTSTSSWAESYTTTAVVTGTDGLETPVVVKPEFSSSTILSSSVPSSVPSSAGSSVQYSVPSSVPSSSGSSSVLSSAGSSSAGSSSVPSSVPSSAGSSVPSSSAGSSSAETSASSAVETSSVGWNESYASTTFSEVSSTKSLSSGFSSVITGSYGLTSSPISVAEKSSYLSTEVKTSVATSTNEVGATILYTKTYTTTYCPTSSSSFTTETKTRVSTSINEVGSTVRFTNTFTTTYCPESGSTDLNQTTYVTAILTIKKSSSTPSTQDGVTTSQVGATNGSSTGSKPSVVTSAGRITSITSITSATRVTSAASAASVASNGTFASSSFYVPHSTSVTILQGGSSALSVLRALFFLLFLALF